MHDPGQQEFDKPLCNLARDILLDCGQVSIPGTKKLELSGTSSYSRLTFHSNAWVTEPMHEPNWEDNYKWLCNLASDIWLQYKLTCYKKHLTS